MSSTHIPAELRRAVRDRAGARCEYCLIPESVTFAVHEIDHIIAEKHGGETAEHNLCLACYLCNSFKGSDLASIDPVTSLVATLFHPRSEIWSSHFQLLEGRIEGVSAAGRATARLLQFNYLGRVEERRLLQTAGLIPFDSKPGISSGQ